MTIIHGFGLLPLSSEANGKIHSPSTSAFRFTEALKVITLRAAIGAPTPVFGLRPGRSLFWRTVNWPKPRRFTSSAMTQDGDDLFEDGFVQLLGLMARQSPDKRHRRHARFPCLVNVPCDRSLEACGVSAKNPSAAAIWMASPVRERSPRHLNCRMFALAPPVSRFRNTKISEGARLYPRTV